MPSTRSIPASRSASIGRLWLWCPVRASVKSMPLSWTMVWSKLPPRMQISVWTLFPPRSRMSMAGIIRSSCSAVRAWPSGRSARLTRASWVIRLRMPAPLSAAMTEVRMVSFSGCRCSRGCARQGSVAARQHAASISPFMAQFIRGWQSAGPPGLHSACPDGRNWHKDRWRCRHGA